MANEFQRALMKDAAAKYAFRRRGPFEGEQQYLDALITHVEGHDFGMAHELRFGRPQAEWTDAEIETFRTFMLNEPPGLHEHGPTDVPIVMDPTEYPLTEDALLKMARDGLRSMTDMRKRDPQRSLLIMVSVLLSTGKLLTAAVHRGDRIALIRHLAQNVPVYGYFVVLDAFIHTLPPEGKPGKAGKRDALIAHVGTRDMRMMMIRPYDIRGDRAVFDPTPPADIDKRGGDVDHDPYAAIFTAPSSDKVQ